MKLHTLLFLALGLSTSVHAACPSQVGRFVPIAVTPSEVLDTKNQLVWARCSVGQSWSGSNCIGVASLFAHETALTYAAAQVGWRVPNVKELASLSDKGCRSPSIDAGVFPNTQNNWYWTASPNAGSTDNVWVVNFSEGIVHSGYYRGYSLFVRLVRTSQ